MNCTQIITTNLNISFGNTEIERIRNQGKNTIRRYWIIFDTVEEAMEFFNDQCG